MSDLDEQIDEVSRIVDALPDPAIAKPIRDLIDAMGARIGELEDETDIVAVTESAEDSEDAINRFLDVVERPVGTRKFIIPETGERDRALVGLYDAIGRNL